MPAVVFLFRALKNYVENFSTVLGFGLLLVFVFLFAQFSNFFISSGSVFVHYNLAEQSLFSISVSLFASIVFLFFYSVFVCLMVFSVRNHLSRVKLQYYLAEKIRKFALKYFVFSVILSLAAFILVSTSIEFSAPPTLAFLILFVIFSFLIFVPQAIVVDEASLLHSVFNNFEFISKNFFAFLFVVAGGIVFLFFLIMVEFALSSFFFVGNIISILVTFFFFIPFFEVLKTRFYMKKFSLITE